jgi:hypothetical protein
VRLAGHGLDAAPEVRRARRRDHALAGAREQRIAELGPQPRERVAHRGLRAVDDHTLLVVENAGTLARLAITGDTAAATAIATGLDQPTGVVVAGGAAWVSEGQLGRLFAQPPQPPHLPFAVVRVAL